MTSYVSPCHGSKSTRASQSNSGRTRMIRTGWLLLPSLLLAGGSNFAGMGLLHDRRGLQGVGRRSCVGGA